MLLTKVATTFARARRELELARRTLGSILGGDPFEPGRTHYETLLVGVFDAARLGGEIKPVVVGDLLAAVAIAALAIGQGMSTTLLVFSVGLAVGVAGVVAAQQRLTHASHQAWDARNRYGQQVLDALDGMQEIMTALPVGTYEARVEASMRERRQLAWLLTLESLVAGRAPIAIGVIAASVFAYVLTRHSDATEWVVLASMLPPFAGLAGAFAAYVNMRAPIQAVRDVLASPQRKNGDRIPTSLRPLTLEDVWVEYGDRPALRGVSGTWSHSFVVAGPNGSGKTTLLRLFAGLATPTRGAFELGGQRSTSVDWERVRHRIAYLPQRPYYPMGATVREAMRFLLGSVDDALLRASLERVDAWRILVEKSKGAPLDVPIDDLSVGERQRVGIARVIHREAELYVLDEPDANLDQAGVDQLVTIISELDARAMVVVAAHTRKVIEALGVRVALYDGLCAVALEGVSWNETPS